MWGCWVYPSAYSKYGVVMLSACSRRGVVIYQSRAGAGGFPRAVSSHGTVMNQQIYYERVYFHE